jgi:hypothetical protein
MPRQLSRRPDVALDGSTRVVAVPHLPRGASRRRGFPDHEPEAAAEDFDVRRLEWNSLRVGDRVLVHDASEADMALRPGTVAMVETASGANDVGIRVADADRRSVVRPNRQAVHRDPLDSREDCWRCDSAVSHDIHWPEAAEAGMP